MIQITRLSILTIQNDKSHFCMHFLSDVWTFVRESFVAFWFVFHYKWKIWLNHDNFPVKALECLSKHQYSTIDIFLRGFAPSCELCSLFYACVTQAQPLQWLPGKDIFKTNRIRQMPSTSQICHHFIERIIWGDYWSINVSISIALLFARPLWNTCKNPYVC